MSFNISQFLVRIRAFWTRDRLVPVLGVTALFLFGLLFTQYVSSLFEERPIVARALVETPDFNERLYELDTRREFEARIHYFRHKDDMKRLEFNRERLDQMRQELDRHRRRLEDRKKVIIKNENGSHEFYLHQGGDKKEIILKNKADEDIRIEVNGEVVKIDRVEEQI